MNAVMNDKFLKKLFMMCVISDMYRLIYKPITNQADDERTVDEQEPSFFPPSETFEDSSPSDRDPEINNTLMSLLTDNNFDVSEEPQVSPPPSPSSPSSLPEPVFEVSEVTLKTGRNKGNVVKRISLI